MTPAQFKPLADQHGLSIPWLAEKVAKVSERTMRYWVNGRPGINTQVPDDVVKRMKALNRALDRVLGEIK
jgi:hypothetical protein